MILNKEYKILKLVTERQLDYHKLLKEVMNGKIVDQFELNDFYKKGYFERTSTSCPTLTVTNFALRAIEEWKASRSNASTNPHHCTVALYNVCTKVLW